jgi:ParB-like chromosome segregation protein Spo0J
LEFHTIANAFPMMEGEEFKELVRDIAEHGHQQPILTHEGKILDGRNRYRARLEMGVEPWTERWHGDSPVEAAVSLNILCWDVRWMVPNW